jgi:hypothetical protein
MFFLIGLYKYIFFLFCLSPEIIGAGNKKQKKTPTKDYIPFVG